MGRLPRDKKRIIWSWRKNISILGVILRRARGTVKAKFLQEAVQIAVAVVLVRNAMVVGKWSTPIN